VFEATCFALSAPVCGFLNEVKRGHHRRIEGVFRIIWSAKAMRILGSRRSPVKRLLGENKMLWNEGFFAPLATELEDEGRGRIKTRRRNRRR